MSSENVEIGKRLNAAFNRGDIEAGLVFFAPDAEFRDLLGAADQQSPVRGIGGIREVLFLWSSAFDELRADVSEWIDAGDVLVVAAHWHGRGRSSETSIDSHQFDVYEFSGGTVVRATLGYRTRSEALRTDGLG